DSSAFRGDAAARALHSFPTRRSSDLGPVLADCALHERVDLQPDPVRCGCGPRRHLRAGRTAGPACGSPAAAAGAVGRWPAQAERSEEHTSELQSREKLVCRLLLEKKK